MKQRGAGSAPKTLSKRLHTATDLLERTEARRVELEAIVERLENVVDDSFVEADSAPELNIDNYTHEQVDELNAAMILTHTALKPAWDEITARKGATND